MRKSPETIKLMDRQTDKERTMIRWNYTNFDRGHGGRVVTLSPPTSEAGVRFPARPQVGKLVVACRWSAVYNTEP